MDELLDKTREFFLRRLAAELNKEVDWRAKGHGRNFIYRAVLYAVALARDLIRIPLHHRDGTAQAHFRVRVEYLSADAIPTLQFFQAEYPAAERQRALIDEALELLQKGVSLIGDGPIPALDEWYATIEEFYELTECSRRAAEKIEEALDAEPTPPH